MLGSHVRWLGQITCINACSSTNLAWPTAKHFMEPEGFIGMQLLVFRPALHGYFHFEAHLVTCSHQAAGIEVGEGPAAVHACMCNATMHPHGTNRN